MLPEPLARALEDGGIDVSAEELLDVLWLATRLPRGATAPLARADADRDTPGGTNAWQADERHGEPPGYRSSGASRPGAPSSRTPEHASTDRTERAPARPLSPGNSGGGLHAAEAHGPQPSSPAVPLRVPEEKVLASEELALSRALRPLKRSRPDPRAWELDERATVTAMAETSLLDPVMRPVSTRWLDLVILVDDGVSMLLWRRLVTEVRQLLERSGAFRTVRIHGLDTRGLRAPRISSRPYLGDDRDSTPAVNASDAAAGSTLLLVLSDGVGAAWQDGRMHALLGRLARQGPTAVLHTLPEPLRASSGIRHRKWQVTTRRAGAANHTWEIRDPVLPAELAPFRGLPVPVIEASAPVVERWARLVGSAGATEELPLLAAASPAPPAPPARSAAEPQDAGHDVLRFRAVAGPEAYRLAAHVAAVAPVTVPVMRLIQKVIGEDVGTGHLAEVFLGGLMRRTDQGGAATRPEHRVFDFPEDTRRILLSTVPASELLRTSQALNSRLCELTGRAPGFAAWLAHDRGTGRVGAKGRPFTVTDERLLRRLGLSLAPTPEPARPAMRERNTDLPEFVGRPDSPWTSLRSDDPLTLGQYNLFARSTTVHGHVVQFLSWSKPFGNLHRGLTLLRVPCSGDAGTDRELARTEADALVRLIGLGAPMLLTLAKSDRPWLAVNAGTTGESGVPAIDLATLLRNNWRPSESRLAWIGAKLAAGLAHAHGKRVVHGSLAPDRVLLAENDVLITDWATATIDGVAGRHRAAHPPEAALLAPELRRDPSAEPTEASDVYALGVVLFTMLTGSGHANARLLDAMQVMVPDSIADVPRRVLRECLDRDPRARPSASRVSRVFRAHLNATAARAAGPSADSGHAPVAYPYRQDEPAPRTVLIGYVARDRVWVEWIAWHMEARGHDVVLELIGADRADRRMSHALEAAEEVVLVLSKSLLASPWYAFSEGLLQEKRVVVLLVDDVPHEDVPEFLRTVEWTRLSGLDEAAAVAGLLEAVDGLGSWSDLRLSIAAQPPRHASQRPRHPTQLTMPQVWNVRHRNADFAGREAELTRLREGFLSDTHGAVQVLYGAAAVGKTQLALEYAHRFAGLYDIVWWLDAEDPDGIPRQFAELSLRLGIGTVRDEITGSVYALFDHLRTRDNWLVILDGVEEWQEIHLWIPDGPGHVLITSRDPAVTDYGLLTHLDVFTRPESLAYLTTRLGITSDDVELLAADLGDHPLALCQAVGVLTAGMPLPRYRALLASDPARLLREGADSAYDASLGSALEVALARLGGNHPDARALLDLTALLGPANVPLTWVPGLLAQRRARNGAPALLPDTVLLLARLGVAEVNGETFRVHQLIQSLIRARIDRETVSRQVTAFLAAVELGRPDVPDGWPIWSVFTAHVTAGHLHAAERPELRPRLLQVVEYLMASEQRQDAHTLIVSLRRTWSETIGADHPDCLRLASALAVVLNYLGAHEEAYGVHRDNVLHHRRVLGPNHPDTIASEYNLALSLHRLGRVDEAVALLRDVLSRSRKVSGLGHPVTERLTKALAALLNLQEKSHGVAEPMGDVDR
ncbi:FxSxx-COOH system tetratricopeptide repeat protein [Streptomyces sp. NPDC059970]|uniref:FxSxx-COOH system tetratricopeptide repeat protein n=1 Tax=Streptomyces sp. NPDC059970 TaxID=3347019 RepID=UPI0036C484B3